MFFGKLLLTKRLINYLPWILSCDKVLVTRTVINGLVYDYSGMLKFKYNLYNYSMFKRSAREWLHEIC